MIISKEILETAKNTIKIEHQAIMQLIDVIDEKASVLRENSIVENKRGKAKLAKTPTMIITIMISSSVKPLLFFIFFILISFYL